MKAEIKIWILLVLTVMTLCQCMSHSVKDRTPLKISVYDGVTTIVRIGDTREQIRKRYQGPIRIQKPKNVDCGVKITEVWYFQEESLFAYFGYRSVIMIIMQLPRKGSIVGKNLVISGNSVSKDSSWRETIEDSFGGAKYYENRALISRALFYRWGDIAYSSLGPTEIALYKNARLTDYRRKTFGIRMVAW